LAGIPDPLSVTRKSYNNPFEQGELSMALEQDLAARVRVALARAGSIREVKMFGGIGFMLNGNMVAAASKRGLMLRVGKERQRDALARPGTREVIMRGRPVEGYIRVDPAGVDDTALKDWVALAAAFVKTLPPKTAGAKTARPKRAAKK
jgi:TfoX/Sxy family transcriptional regulator of competence genes